MNRQFLPLHAINSILRNKMNPELPGTYVNLLIETIKHWNVSPQQLLIDTDITLKKLDAPFWYVDFNIFNNLLEKSAKLTNEPAISIYLAREMKASCYGHVGVTATASENLGVAISVFEQFIGLHCVAFQPKLYIEQEMAYLNFNQPLSNFKFNRHAIIFLVLGFTHILENLAQQNLDIQIELQGNSQDIFRNIDNSDGYRVNFGADEDRLIFNKELLNLPLKTADPLVFRLTKRQCEYDVSKLSKKISPNLNLISSSVRELLYDAELQQFLSLNQIAKHLGLTNRTLQRQLTNEKTTFQILLSESRQEKAKALLKENKLSIQEISNLLGYADISHFSRAFKKWTNMTPSNYRMPK